MKKTILGLALTSSLATLPNLALADCAAIDNELGGTYQALKTALSQAQNGALGWVGGFRFEMWGTIVDRDGIVCAVAFSGTDRGSQWPGSRAISAQKANTANSYSLPNFALSTANLYGATQPGGSLWGLFHSNPVDTAAAYQGPSENYGQSNDPLVGKKIGGVNAFGGGLALYTQSGELLGALGVSGDTSCADHNIAWYTRRALNLDFVPAGVSANGDDNIVYGAGNHPICGLGEKPIAEAFPKAGT